MPVTQGEELFAQRVLGVSCGDLMDTEGVESAVWTERVKECTAGSSEALTRSVIDSIVLERMNSKDSSPAKVLLDMFIKLSDGTTMLNSIYRDAHVTSENEKNRLREASETVLDLVVSYLGMLLMWPNIFGLGEREVVPSLVFLRHYVSKASEFENGAQDPCVMALQHNFLTRFIGRWGSDPSFEEVLNGLFMGLIFTIRGVLNEKDFMVLAAFVYALLQFPQVIPVLIKSDAWMGPAVNGSDFETNTLLGVLLTYSSITSNTALVNRIVPQSFPDPLSQSGRELYESLLLLQGVLRKCRIPVINIFKTFIKHSAQAKEALLVWIAGVINSNLDRMKFRYDRNKCSSDGMLINLLDTVLSICGPLAKKPTCTDADIDLKYLLTDAGKKRLHLENVTVMASQEDMESVSKKLTEGIDNSKPASFASEMFFMTMMCIELAYTETVTQLRNISRQAQIVDNSREKVKNLLQNAKDPAQILDLKKQMESIENRLSFILQLRHAYQTLVLDTELLKKMESMLAFFSRTSVKMITDTEKKALFLSYPECFLMNISSVLGQGVLTINMFFMPNYLEEMLDLMFWAIGTTELHNPSLRTSFVLCLRSFIPSKKNQQMQAVSNMSIVENHALQYGDLAGALFRFYVDVEKTGTSSQFFDKFNDRRIAQKVFKHFWTLQPFREKVNQFILSSNPVDKELFSKVVLYVINDTNYELDESLTKLGVIRSIEKERSNESLWARLSEEERVSELDRMESAEGSVRVVMNYSYANLRFLKCIAHDTDPRCRSVFMNDSVIVSGLTSMLDYFLAQLVGANSSELKVSNPEKYDFDPKLLVTLLVELYCTFASSPQFQEAIAKDNRSYTPELMERAQSTLAKHFSLGYGVTQSFSELAEKIATIYRSTVAEESMLDDFPDEFSDALMCTLMHDPVELPSGNVVDRETITRMLMSDPLDPFTRIKMTINDVKPLPELKARIDAWIHERLTSSSSSK